MTTEKGTWGGAREGAGRPAKEKTRVMKSLRAYDDEWELIKVFARHLKGENREVCEQFLKKLEEK